MRHLSAFLIFCCILPADSNESDPLPEWCKSLPRPAYKSLHRVLPEEPWFEIYRIRPGVFALYEPRQFEEVISYLVVGSKRALLLDTGMGIVSIRDVVKKLTSLPVIVLNTHTHPDHVGGNAEFEEIWGRDTAFTRGNSKGYDHASVKDFVKPSDFCGKIPGDFDPQSYAIRPFRISKFIRDGDEMDLGGRRLRILEVPGHTPDSLVVFDEMNKLLFTGDSFYAGPIYLFLPETDFNSYKRSVEKLATLESKLELLLPAHNEPVASPAYLKKLRDAIDAIEHGKVKPEIKDEIREFPFEGFSLLLHR